jgi:hypothetical protein
VSGVKINLTGANLLPRNDANNAQVRKLRRFGAMALPNVVLAGEKSAAGALESALLERDIGVSFHVFDSLPDAFVDLERELSGERPAGAVAVGTGEGALALAITASKLGVRLACVSGQESGEDADQRRILATLASLDAGSDPDRAADLIASWLSDDQPASDLD